MGFWFTLFFYAFTTILQAVLNKPDREGRRPSGLDDFDFPTATEGRSIPIGVGKFKQGGINVLWAGDLRTEPVFVETKNFTSIVTDLFGAGDTKQKVADKYFLGLQCQICSGPIDGVDRIWVADKVVASGETTGPITVTDLKFFGNDEAQGGIDFQLDLYLGDKNQAADPYIATFQNRFPEGSSTVIDPPRYPGVAYFVLSDGAGGPGYIGNTNRLSNIAIEAFWYPNSLGLTGGKERIGDDANPICFLYELVANSDDWGAQISGTDVLLAGSALEGAFRAVGEQVFDEGLGFSGVISSLTQLTDIIDEIGRHVDGIFRLDFSDGFFKITLARGETPAVTLDQSNIDELVDYRSPSWETTKNQIKIGYNDRAKGYSPTFAFDDAPGNREILNIPVDETLNFPFVKTAAVANVIAPREMRSRSFPLTEITALCDSSTWQIQRGDAVFFTWDPLGITELAMRVIEVREGNDRTSQRRIRAVEDVFSLETATFVEPPATGALPVDATPLAVLFGRLWQIPASLTDERRVVALGARANGLHIGFDIWADTTGGTTFSFLNSGDQFSGLAQLESAVAFGATSFTVDRLIDMSSGRLLSLESGALDTDFLTNVILVGEELIQISALTIQGDGSVDINTAVRGVLGTFADDHAIDEPVYFLGFGGGIVGADPVDDLITNLTVRILPKTNNGTLALGDASDLSIIVTAPPVPIPPIVYNFDAYSLILHFDGTDGDVTTDDTSVNDHPVTFLGSARIEEDESVFGPTSLYMPAAADGITVPDDPVFEYGTDDFLIQLRVRLDALSSGNQIIWSQRPASGNHVSPLIYQLFNGQLAVLVNGVNVIGPTAVVLTAATQHAIAFARVDGVSRLFVDGVQVGSDYADTNDYVSDVVRIGGDSGSSGGMAGYIDEVLVLKGTGLFDDNYTVPGEYLFDRVVFLAGFDGLDGETSSYTSEDRYARTGTFLGSASLGDLAPKFGTTALELDGVGDAISFVSTAELQLLDNDFTISAWIRKSSADFGDIVAKYNATANDRAFAFSVDGSGELRFLYSTDGTNLFTVQATDTPAISLDTYYHVQVCREGATVYLFFNGTLLTATGDNIAAASIDNNAQPLIIGNRGAGTTTDFAGVIDEVQIIKGRALNTASFTPPTVPNDRV